MLMLEQRIQQQFFDSADLQYQTAESLGRPIAEAAQALIGCITGGGKLLVGGLLAISGVANAAATGGSFVDALRQRGVGFTDDGAGNLVLGVARSGAPSPAPAGTGSAPSGLGSSPVTPMQPLA